MRFFCFILFLITTITSMSANNIECSYEYFSWTIVDRTYHCDVQYGLSIRSPDTAVIQSVDGKHDYGKDNSDVNGFYVYNKVVKYFPKGIEKFYKNIKLIIIHEAEMTKVHESDLKPFPKLLYLSLNYNKIEVLGTNLFTNNPELQYISFTNNKISHINPNIFDHLNSLIFLLADSNHCISDSVYDDAAGVKSFIQKIKGKCPSPEPEEEHTSSVSEEEDSTPTPTEEYSNIMKIQDEYHLKIAEAIEKSSSKNLSPTVKIIAIAAAVSFVFYPL